MNRGILFTFFASLVLILSGCGSNDKIDSGSGSMTKKVLNMQAQPMIITGGKDFNVSIPVIKTVSDQYKVTMQNFKLETEGCDIERISLPVSLEMNGGIGSVGLVNVSGNFKSDCTPTKYTLKFDQTISDGTRSKTEEITLDSNNPSPGQGAGLSGYRFYNSNTPLKVSIPNRGYDLKVQLIKDNFVTVGKNIKILAFNSMYGNLDQYEVTTGSDGYAVFKYTSPEPLPGNGVSAVFTAEFMDDSNNTITKDLIITFDTNSSTTDDINTSLPVAIIPTENRNVTLTNNSQSVDIPVKVYKDGAIYSEGEVMVELPREVLNGTDVGSFSAYHVPVNEQGVALFHYTGPSNLQALIGSNHLGSIFKFYHSENTAPGSKQPMNVIYRPSSDYVPIDYRVIVNTQNNDFSMGIPDLTKTFSIVLQKSDGSDVGSADATVTKVTVQTENDSVAKIYDSANDRLVNSLVLQSSTNSQFILKSKKLSGIVPIRATVEFKDANGDAKTLETVVNIRVMSGPPSAISVSYAGTSQDSNRSKYIERFAISVTDEYGNSVNTKPYISLGAIAGYTVDGREASSTETHSTKRLFYGRNDINNNIANGSLDNLADSDPATTQFEALVRPDVFKYVNKEGPNTDKLVIFGAGKNYEAMGKWDFEKINNTTLKLQDDYYGIDRTELSYAVGRNYYQDQCLQDGREWIGNTASDTYQLDDHGTVLIEYRYDYHLAGKDVMVWVNLDGIQPDTGKRTRIGEAVKHTLRTTGLKAVPKDGYNVPKGETRRGTFWIWHENAPERYRNAHFAYLPKSGSNCYAIEIRSSNYFYHHTTDANGTILSSQPTGVMDARTCNNGSSSVGGSYVEFQLTAPVDKDCTFAIESIIVSQEF